MQRPSINKTFGSKADGEYEPGESSSEESYSNSSTFSSSRSSSYDPLANIEEYLKMRDNLWKYTFLLVKKSRN